MRDESSAGDEALDRVGCVDQNRLGAYIESARTRALLSRRELAARLSVTEETVRRWERGGAQPHGDHIARLLAVLSLDGSQFTSGARHDRDLPALAQLLKDERYRRGMTQAAASRLLSVAQATFAGWEIGRAVPAAAYHATLAAFLGLSVDEVSGLAETPFVVNYDDWPPLGHLIGSQRQRCRVTREQLAKELGVTTGTITSWELGYRSPRPQQISAICTALVLDPRQIDDLLLEGRPHLSSLGRLIESQQRKLGLRRSDIAARARVDEATLSRWVHGTHAPAVRSLRRLAAALDVPFEVVADAAT